MSRRSSSNIPDEIYREILLRVTPKSTFVCKCVCKTWLSLISDSSFVTEHIDLTLQINITSNLLVFNSKDVMHSVIIDPLEPSLSENNEFITEIRYPYESESVNYVVKIIGSCNGLVCLKFFYVWEEFVFFCVWNPVTREYKKINRPADDIDINSKFMHVFCYDHKNNNYKLVIGVMCDDEETTTTLVYVYTLESDSWKTAVRVPYYFSSYIFSGILFNGDFHFLAERGQESLMVSLDISEERFNEIELSTELKGNGHWYITEAVFDGCLSLLTIVGPEFVTESDPEIVELWVMQDYGVTESWTRRYIVSHEIITRRFLGPFLFDYVSSSKNGEILLKMYGCLILYNPKDGSAIERDLDIVSEVKYFESLVSVNSGTYVTQGQIEEEPIQEPEEA